MLPAFALRARAFENRFAHEESLRLCSALRRDRLLANWAAECLGMDAESAEAYATSITHREHVAAEAADREALFTRLRDDLQMAKNPVDEQTIHEKMQECLERAMTELTQPKPAPRRAG